VRGGLCPIFMCQFGPPQSVPRRTHARRSRDRWLSAVLLMAAGTWLAQVGWPLQARKPAAPVPAPAEPAVEVQPSPQLFVTLCALYAAGHPVPASLQGAPVVVARRASSFRGPVVDRLRQFYSAHRGGSAAETLSRYVSFAFMVGPPPDFALQYPKNQLPPEIQTLEGWQALLAEFYREQPVAALWEQVQTDYRQQALRMRAPLAQFVRLGTGYLRELELEESGRRFLVLVEPLLGNVAEFRIYGERYVLALDPARPGALDDVRHAFLHFLVDPLVFRHRAEVNTKRFLLNYAVRAPQLPELYRNDFVALADECLVRAIALRLEKPSPAALNTALDRSDREGYTLVRPLYSGLSRYEESELSFEDYFPDLFRSIDLSVEARREEQIVFSPAEPEAPRAAEPVRDDVAYWLAQGNQQIAEQHGSAAVESFEQALARSPENPRALYGLAVASLLTGQGQRARGLLERLARSEPVAHEDPEVAGWAHVYLGRLDDLQGRREEALQEYRAALDVQGIPEPVRRAAESGLREPYRPTRPEARPQPR
jgi:hypothetical protein